MTASREDTRSCPTCGTVHQPIEPPPGRVACCRHCSTPLKENRRFSLETSLAFAATAAIAFLTLTFLPLMSVQKIGLERSIHLGGIGGSLVAEGMPLLGTYVHFCLIIGPVLLLAGALVLPLAARLNRPFPGWRLLLALTEFARRWSMPEVLLLAIVVSFLKIGALAEASVGLGFIMLVLGTTALTVAMQIFDPAEVRRRLQDAESATHRRHRQQPPASDSVPLAFLVAAAIMLIPANTLPMMEASVSGKIRINTIFGGIQILWNEGMWAIGLIVFIASFLVPLGKLIGLGWLIHRSRTGRGGVFEVKLHRFLDFIGRWSMLDILLIGLLAGLIQFGPLGYVRPGPAAPAFAAAVILTIIAVETFPPRLLFPPSGMSPPPTRL
jgi:paraquat-inducible protein A